MNNKLYYELRNSLRDEKSCREFLEMHRWQNVPICPHCNCKSEKHYKLKRSREFNGLYKCRECKKTFTVTTRTIFENSKVPLNKWFDAIHLFLSHKSGISSIQLSKDIGVTQKTAWFMLTKIRHNLNNLDFIAENKFDGEVQMDETYIGGKSKGRIWQNQGRSLKQKIPVVGILTNDRVYAVVVPNATGKTLKTIIYGLIKSGATIVTDAWKGYHGISPEYHHKIVEHTKGSYKNKEGYHTNSIEGFWGHLKPGIKSTYRWTSHKYLQFYCDEFSYRYNTRNITDGERFIQFMTSKHRKLRYCDLFVPS